MTNETKLRLLNSKEVAKILNLGQSTIYKKAKSGDLRCVRLDKSIRFLPEDVFDYIQKNRSDYGDDFEDISNRFEVVD